MIKFDLKQVVENLIETFLSAGKTSLILREKGLIKKIKSDNTLAGSIVTMDQTFRNLISMNFSLEEAVSLTSYNASRYLNLNNIGVIKKYFQSNILVLDKEFNLKEVYLKGKKINVWVISFIWGTINT